MADPSPTSDLAHPSLTPTGVQEPHARTGDGAGARASAVTARVAVGLLLAGAVGMAGCQAPQRGANYPAGALQVRYEAAGHTSSCLVAAVVMAANYLLDDHRYSEPAVRQTLSRLKLDEKRVGDLKHYLAGEGLHLVTLVGTIDGKPPISLRYWLLQRGYPVICVINRHSDDPAFNHAVVVIGISPSAPAESADTVYYLDPSSARMLHQEPTPAFEALWARGGHAMMVVVAPRQPG